jgi:hypothetical protein
MPLKGNEQKGCSASQRVPKYLSFAPELKLDAKKAKPYGLNSASPMRIENLTKLRKGYLGAFNFGCRGRPSPKACPFQPILNTPGLFGLSS